MVSESALRHYWRLKCKTSFWWFFKYAYGYDFNPQGGGGNRHWLRPETHLDACLWFERHVLAWLAARRAGRGYPLRLAVVVPRDWGKTTLFTQAGLLWLHLHDPDISTYIGSETLPKSEKWLSSPLEVLSGADKYSRFAWLYGNGFSLERRWKKDHVVSAFRTNLTRKEPSFSVWGVEQGATGDHPDVGSLDDPTSYEKMRSHSDWLGLVNAHYASLIPVFQGDSFLLMPGTRYADDDHFGTLFEKEGVASISGRTIAEDGKPYIGDLPDYDARPNGTWHVYYLSAQEPNTRRLTMPHIWPRWRIDNFDAIDPLRCAAQVRNDPTTSALAPITKEEVDRCIRGRLSDYDWKRMYITIHMDTAFKRPGRVAKGDETVLQAWGHMRDSTGTIIYWGGWGDNRMNGDQLRDLLYETVKNLRNAGAFIRCITDETETGGKTGVWESLLRTKFVENKQIMPEFIYIQRHTTADAKYRRMCEAAGFWKRGFVILPSDAPGLVPLTHQMARIGTSKRKDWADVAADPFHALVYEALNTLGATEDITFLDDPFADILKPGLKGLIAADKVAEFYHQQEQHAAWLDPIQ